LFDLQLHHLLVRIVCTTSAASEGRPIYCTPISNPNLN
jgi:hypothetical protein